MAAYCSYDSDAEWKQHSRAMQMLARDLGIPEEDIRAMYETMLCSLKEGARIKDYLAILVSRNIKDMVRRAVVH